MQKMFGEEDSLMQNLWHDNKVARRITLQSQENDAKHRKSGGRGRGKSC
jgi:hypothetical protein